MIMLYALKVDIVKLFEGWNGDIFFSLSLSLSLSLSPRLRDYVGISLVVLNLYLILIFKITLIFVIFFFPSFSIEGISK